MERSVCTWLRRHHPLSHRGNRLVSLTDRDWKSLIVSRRNDHLQRCYNLKTCERSNRPYTTTLKVFGLLPSNLLSCSTTIVSDPSVRFTCTCSREVRLVFCRPEHQLRPVCRRQHSGGEWSGRTLEFFCFFLFDVESGIFSESVLDVSHDKITSVTVPQSQHQVIREAV